MEGHREGSSLRYGPVGKEEHAAHVAAHVNPLSKSRFEKLCVLLKRKNHDVLGLPLDLLYPRNPLVPIPIKVPGPMHCVMKTLKVILALIQSVGVGSNPDSPSKKEGLLQAMEGHVSTRALMLDATPSV
jgi:hypothetical protein